MPAQDPLLDFPSETTFVYAEPMPINAAWPMTNPPIHAIDTTSRVISFVLGFALDSLIAWLGTIPGDEVAATRNSQPVAAAGTPSVTAAIEEKQATTRSLPETPAATPAPAPVTPRATVAAVPNPSPRPVTATATLLAAGTVPPVVAATVPVANPPRTAEPVAAPVRPLAAAAPVRAPAASGYRGALVLNSSPQGAEVVLNGKVVGQTPVTLNDLPVGSRALIVRREGYSPWSASVRIVAGQRTTVRATLVPTSETGG